jgi:hypothetical protein
LSRGSQHLCILEVQMNKKPARSPKPPEPSQKQATEPPETPWPPPRPTVAAMIEDLSKTDPLRWIRRF